jgi:hypothetical protein
MHACLAGNSFVLVGCGVVVRFILQIGKSNIYLIYPSAIRLIGPLEKCVRMYSYVCMYSATSDVFYKL